MQQLWGSLVPQTRASSSPTDTGSPSGHCRAILAVCPGTFVQHRSTGKSFIAGFSVCRYAENTCYSRVCPGEGLLSKYPRRVVEQYQIQDFL